MLAFEPMLPAVLPIPANSSPPAPVEMLAALTVDRGIGINCSAGSARNREVIDRGPESSRAVPGPGLVDLGESAPPRIRTGAIPDEIS